MIDRMPENYGWRFVTLYRRQESRPFPKEKKCKKGKWLFKEALQIAVKRREEQRHVFGGIRLARQAPESLAHGGLPAAKPASLRNSPLLSVGLSS